MCQKLAFIKEISQENLAHTFFGKHQLLFLPLTTVYTIHTISSFFPEHDCLHFLFPSYIFYLPLMKRFTKHI